MNKDKFNKTVIASKNATTNPYKASESQKSNVFRETLDLESMVFPMKLYLYDAFGVGPTGIASDGTQFNSWADFQQRMYEVGVLQRNLASLTPAGTVNENIISISLSYTNDTRVDQTKHYIEAVYDEQKLNFFYQQNQDFANWGQDKNLLSLFVKTNFSLDNRFWYFSYNEDLMLLSPIQPGDPLPNNTLVYTMEFFAPIGMNGDGEFNYGLIGLKKSQPYMVFSNGQRMNTQFSVNNPILDNIDRIRLKISGPFWLNAIFVWNSLNSIQQLDYRVVNGPELREISITPIITVNSIKWASDSIEALQHAWNVWKYARGVEAFTVYNVKTSDGNINTNGVTGINIQGEVLRGGMKHSDGGPGGTFITIPNNPLAFTPLKDYYPNPSDYTGNGEYKLFYYSNRLGNYIDDGLSASDPYNLLKTLTGGVSDFFELSGTPTYENRQSNGEGGEEASENGKPESRFAWKRKIAPVANAIKGGFQWTVNWLEYFSNLYGNDSTDYGNPSKALPRAWRNKTNPWNVNSVSLYRLDATNLLRPNNLGFTKEYFSFISKPVKSDINFAIKQGLGSSYYYDSSKNHINKARLITKTIYDSIASTPNFAIFPTWLQPSKLPSGDNSSIFFAKYTAVSPFTQEQLMPYFKPIDLPNYNIPMISYFYPVNTIRGNKEFRTPTIEYPARVDRYMENSAFLRPFTSDEITLLNLSNSNPELNNKYVIDFYPVENNTTNRRQTISNLTGFMSAIYGGYNLEWEFYTVLNKKGAITEVAYNRENALRAAKTRIIGTKKVDLVNPEDRPIIDDWVQTSDLSNNMITNLTLNNPNDLTTNIKSVIAVDLATNVQYTGTISTVTPNFEYNFTWNNLEEGKTYELRLEWSYNEPGVGEVILPEEILVAAVTVLGPELRSATITALNSALLEITLDINLNGATVIEKEVFAVSSSEIVPASEFTEVTPGRYLIKWNNTLTTYVEYNIQLRVYWYKDQYSDSIYNEDIIVTIPAGLAGNIWYSIQDTLLDNDQLARTVGTSLVDINYNPTNATQTNNYNAMTRFGSGNYNINVSITPGIVTQWDNLRGLNVSDPANNRWVPVVIHAAAARKINGPQTGTMGIYIYGTTDNWVNQQIVASTEFPIYYDLIYPQVIQEYSPDVVLTTSMQFRFKVGIKDAPSDVVWLWGVTTQGSAIRNRITLQFQNRVTGQVIDPFKAKELEVKDLEIEKLKLEIENLKKVQ